MLSQITTYDIRNEENGGLFMKKYLCFAMIFALLFVQAIFTVSADPQVTITVQIGNEIMSVNGNTQEVDPGRGTVPVILEARTLLPIRVMIESLGGVVGWVDEDKLVTIDMDGNSIKLSMANPQYKEALVFMGVGKPYETIGFHEGSKSMTVNGEMIKNDVPAIIINERTFMPLRFISENVGCEVLWEDATKTVTVLYEGSTEPTTIPQPTTISPSIAPTEILPTVTTVLPSITTTLPPTVSTTIQPSQTPTLTPVPSETPTGIPEGVEGWDMVPYILASIKPIVFLDNDYDITTYGAVGDGQTDCLPAIKTAIDECNSAGGGRVLVPPGEYFVEGPIHLKSNVNLHITSGAKIQFTSEFSKFMPVVFTRYEGLELMNYSPPIYAYEQENIAITGEGIVDGGGRQDTWWGWKRTLDTESRPVLMQMAEDGVPAEERIFGDDFPIRVNFIQPYKCKNVLIEGITVNGSPMWCINPVLCENVTVKGVTVDSHGSNNDGCNPESCKNVLIKDCYFDTGDDCIAIKSGRNEDGRRIGVPSENIVVQNCHMKDGHGGVTMGSEMSGGIRNVFAEDCFMDSPDLKRVLRIKTNSLRGGYAENVYMRNIEIMDLRDSVIRVNFQYSEGDVGEHTPYVRNITVENVTSHGGQQALDLEGYERSPISNLKVINCEFNNLSSSEPVSMKFVEDVVFDNVTINGELYTP